jgi:hypothetical protein
MRRLSSRQAITAVWEGSSCRLLAARIVQQAFRDLASPAGSRSDQESARVFLSGSSMLSHWCAVADLDPVWLVARAAKLDHSARRRLRQRIPSEAPKQHGC